MTWNISKLWKNDNTSKLRFVPLEKDYESHTNDVWENRYREYQEKKTNYKSRIRTWHELIIYKK